MQITFKNKHLKESCSDSSKRLRTYGESRSKKIGQRLDELQAAATLADMLNLPGRCHELKGNLAGFLALDLDGAYRLLFEPDHDPVPVKEDSGLDWNQVTRIRVIKIEDYHG